MKDKMKGFTLVELLAVIVILAIILVIAVPQVMSVIEDSKKATLESTAKMIASAAEKAKVQNTVLGNETQITCDSVAKINKLDYEDCDIEFDNNTAKVTIKGSGKFEGLHVCEGTKTSASATNDECVGSIEVGEFGTDSWETIVRAVKQAETKGIEYPYNVGDEKAIEMDIDRNGEVEQYTVRIANKTKCSALETETLSKSACGFVLEFKDIIKKMGMRDTNTNVGGWPATNVRTYLNDENDATSLYNLLPTALSEKIINTYVVSSHGKDDETGNLADDNFGYDDKIYLLSPEEVYGASFKSAYDTAKRTSRQLDYYESNEVTTSSYGGAIKNYQGSVSYWWLRSAHSVASTSFYGIIISGGNDEIIATDTFGVSPAFRLGE